MALTEKQKKAVFVAAYVKAKQGEPVRPASASKPNPPPAETQGSEDLTDGIGAELRNASRRAP